MSCLASNTPNYTGLRPALWCYPTNLQSLKEQGIEKMRFKMKMREHYKYRARERKSCVAKERKEQRWRKTKVVEVQEEREIKRISVKRGRRRER